MVVEFSLVFFVNYVFLLQTNKLQSAKLCSDSLLSIRSLCSEHSYRMRSIRSSDNTTRRFRSLQRGKKYRNKSNCYVTNDNRCKFMSCSCFYESHQESDQQVKRSNLSLASSTCSRSKFAVEPVKNFVEEPKEDRNNNLPTEAAPKPGSEKERKEFSLLRGKQKKINRHNLSGLLLRLNKFKQAQIRHNSKKHKFCFGGKNCAGINKTESYQLSRAKHGDGCVLM